jgi:hypothetical protein
MSAAKEKLWFTISLLLVLSLAQDITNLNLFFSPDHLRAGQETVFLNFASVASDFTLDRQKNFNPFKTISKAALSPCWILCGSTGESSRFIAKNNASWNHREGCTAIPIRASPLTFTIASKGRVLFEPFPFLICRQLGAV